MPLAEDFVEYTPRETFFNSGNTSTLYVLRGTNVQYLGGGSPLRGVNLTTFRFYRSRFAKDCNGVYCAGSKLRDGNGATFRMLNHAFGTDGTHVWTMGGKIDGVDVDSFVVCDDGAKELFGGKGKVVPYGYAKDAAKVYYYDFDGKPMWVRRAIPESFESMNDGYFGRDEKFVFCSGYVLNKAKVNSWEQLPKSYSRDAERIFYFGREIEGADRDSFTVVPTQFKPLAYDTNRFYSMELVISQAEFEKLRAHPLT